MHIVLMTCFGTQDSYVSVMKVALSGTTIKLPHISYTFADVALGKPVTYIGSDGYLELAVRNGKAAEEWKVGLGREIVLEKK